MVWMPVCILTVCLSSETLSRKQSGGHSSIPRFGFGNDMLIRIERLADFGVPTPRLTHTMLRAAWWQTLRTNSKKLIREKTYTKTDVFFFCICHRNRNGWIILFGNSCTITATMNGIQFNLLLQLDAHSWRWRWRYTQNGSEYGACGRNLSPLLTTAANVFNLVFFFKLINHNWNRFNSKLEKTQWYLSIDERPSIEGKSPEWNACAQIWKRRYELYYHSREIMHIRGEIERPRERRLSLMTMRTHTAFLVGPPCLCRAWCSLIQSPHRISRCMKIAAWIFIFTLITTL